MHRGREETEHRAPVVRSVEGEGHSREGARLFVKGVREANVLRGGEAAAR